MLAFADTASALNPAWSPALHLYTLSLKAKATCPSAMNGKPLAAGAESIFPRPGAKVTVGCMAQRKESFTDVGSPILGLEVTMEKKYV